MEIKFRRPQRVITMRTPFSRALLAALCVLLLLMVTLRTRSLDICSHIFQNTAVNTPIVAHQQPLNEAYRKGRPRLPVFGGEGARPTHQGMNCDIDIPHLADVQQRYKLKDKFQYMKRYVHFTRTQGLQRKSITKLSQNLLAADFETVDATKQYPAGTCGEPLEVQVPASALPSTVNASDFMFGVSTTYRRFKDPAFSPISEWTFWLTDSRGHSNGGKLLLMLLDASDAELQEVANLLGDVGIDVDVYHSESSVEMAARYLNLVPTLFNHPDAHKKKWLVTCDDDTFFPSMQGLIDKFRRFDHTLQMYVGTLSEDIGAIQRHGSQAFGGAGVFLSIPLAKKVTEMVRSCTTDNKIRESNSGWGPQGDILLRKCIYENTETRLTNVWDLWQMDINSDPAGFFEWGIKPLSLHHYRGGGWYKAHPAQLTKIAHTCGEDCTMMRFQTDDGFIMSGYSISHYPEGITFDTAQMEGTLQNKGWNFDFKFGPQRPSLHKTGRKISWDLKESDVRSDGSVLQTYIRKQDDARWVTSGGKPMSNIDGVIELVWIPS